MPEFWKRYLVILAFLLTQGLVSIIGGLVFAANPGENVIFPGVSINGTYIGGLTKEQAFEKLNQEISQKQKSARLVLRYGDSEWVFSYDALGFRPDIEATVDKALKMGHTNNILTDGLEIFRLRREKPDFPVEYTVDNEILKSIQAGIMSQINVAVKDAGIDFEGSRLKINREVTGKNYRASVNDIKIREALGRLQVVPVLLDVSEVRPRYTASDLAGIKEPVGLGVTPLSRGNGDRKENIFVAVGALNGQLVRPGEVFSFNQIMGPAVQEVHYRNISTVADGRAVGESSGASQVATTLYQAALYAGLEIMERHPHAVAPGYVAGGQDAAVVLGQLDLRFKNNSMTPVYIHSEVKNGRIIVQLLGARREGETVQILTEKILNTTSSGISGLHTRVYRIFYINGAEGRRELVSQDDYVSGQ